MKCLYQEIKSYVARIFTFATIYINILQFTSEHVIYRSLQRLHSNYYSMTAMSNIKFKWFEHNF